MLQKGSFGSLFWLCLAGLALAADDSCRPDAATLAALPSVKVAQVFDGDTVQLGDGRKVRLIGINTPELAHDERPEEPLAREATAELARWQSKTVKLQVGKDERDRYGRTLGHLFSPDGDNLTALLLARGLGFPVTFPPNVSYADCYRRQAEVAREQAAGVWRHGYFRLRSPAVAADLQGGFGRYRGQIERVSVTKKVIWIDFIGDLSVRVARKDMAYIEGDVLDQLLQAVDQGRVLRLPQLIVSGWVMDRTQWGEKMAKQVASGKRNRWQLNIRHRNHWQWSDPGSGLL